MQTFFLLYILQDNLYNKNKSSKPTWDNSQISITCQKFKVIMNNIFLILNFKLNCSAGLKCTAS